MKQPLPLFFSFMLLIFITFFAAAQTDNIGSSKMEMVINGNTLKIPYYASQSLDQVDSTITNGVIVIHGVNRNAKTYFSNMEEAANKRPTETTSTFIIAPQFLTEEDIDFYTLDNEHLYWSSGGWQSGSNSRNNSGNPRPERIPSYAVLDTLMMRLVQNFPSLKTIVFTGHSAGGQLTNRYSATSPMADDLCQQYEISTKFIVANPGSYVYMDGKRRVNGTNNSFAIPTTSCSAFNEWRYGLEDLFTYPARAGVDSIRSMLKRREVVYLLGENDNNPNDSNLDTDCEAILQGIHRLERGSIYYNYLIDFYGDEIKELQSLDTVPNAGHSNFDMYNSDIGLFHLFESPPNSCSEIVVVSANEQNIQPIKIFPNPATEFLQIDGELKGTDLIIYDLLGRKRREVQNIFGSNYKMDVNALKEGTYVLEIRTKGKKWGQLFVKNKH